MAQWGLCLGLALSYPHDFTEPITRYLLKIASLAAMTALELTAIQKTGIIDRILQIYRTQYIDNQLVSALCIVLLISPIVELITKYILNPLLITRTNPLVIKVISVMACELLWTALNNTHLPEYVAQHARSLSLDFHALITLCVMFILVPLNTYIFTQVLRRIKS